MRLPLHMDIGEPSVVGILPACRLQAVASPALHGASLGSTAAVSSEASVGTQHAAPQPPAAPSPQTAGNGSVPLAAKCVFQRMLHAPCCLC